ncbi:MAG TPA: restriction endonuclease subunit S [Bacillota bacterium]|nr:restriction endonuclease subunit S [Bacillota bacterium]
MTSKGFDQYDSYKDTGVEKMGVIPEHWKVTHLKRISKKITDGEHISPEFTEQGMPFLSAKDIRERKIILQVDKYVDYENGKKFRKRCNPQKGDLLIVSRGATIGRIGLIETDKEFCLLGSVILIKTRFLKVDNIFLFYFFNARITQANLFLTSQASAQQAIYLADISVLFILLPPIIEQTAIAEYLDSKVAQIDCEIDLLTQKAIQYGELKQSLISETVTHGIDKTLAMKDSEVEWIGEVPEHWAVKRINDISSQNKKKNLGVYEKNLLSLSYGKIIRKDFDTSFGLLPESFETYQIVNAGNIILRLTDLQNDKKSFRVGLVKERGIITSAYLGLKFSKAICPEFAYYLLFAYDISKVFYWFGGGLRQSMKFDDIKVLPFIVPPIEEQRAIADYLDTKTTHIENIVETINLQIDKLKELRKTLINDVVTGKIKVIGKGDTL